MQILWNFNSTLNTPSRYLTSSTDFDKSTMNGVVPLYMMSLMQIYIYHNFFIRSSVDGQLGSFHVLAIVDSGAMNIGVHVSFQTRVFVFSGYLPRSGIAGSYGNSIFSF